MFLKITGFLQEDTDDDSLKFSHDFPDLLNESVLKVMRWSNLENNSNGVVELSKNEIDQIEIATGAKLPKDLALFLGVYRGLPVSIRQYLPSVASRSWLEAINRAGIAPLYVALSVRPGDHKYETGEQTKPANPSR